MFLQNGLQVFDFKGMFLMYLMLPFLEYRVFFSAFCFLVGRASAAHRAGRRDRSAYFQRGNIGNIANICLVSMGYAATNGFECSKCYRRFGNIWPLRVF